MVVRGRGFSRLEAIEVCKWQVIGSRRRCNEASAWEGSFFLQKGTEGMRFTRGDEYAKHYIISEELSRWPLIIISDLIRFRGV